MMKVTWEEVKGKRRLPYIVRVRHRLARYLTYKGLSSTEVGRKLNRERSTISCALRKWKPPYTQPPPIGDKVWLIWSIEHEAWWKDGGWGYTQLRSEAGRYSEIQARRIVYNSNHWRKDDSPPGECMVYYAEAIKDEPKPA